MSSFGFAATVAGVVDFPHAARADRRKDLVGTEPGTW